MRVLLAIARYDYGKVINGPSYEYNAWVGPLATLGHEVDVFDTFDPRWPEPAAAGRALEERVAESRPDLVLMMLLEHDVDLSSVDRIRRTTPIANWFSDDSWRYAAFSRHVAPHFSWVVTTARAAEAEYRRRSEVRAIFSPWGYDPQFFHPVAEPGTPIDVGFVGQRYGSRGKTVEALVAHGFSVETHGSGWPAGRIDADDLAQQFARTRINLNFLESSAGPFQRRAINRRGTWRFDRAFTNRFPPPTQLKARPFEITACGGFLLTNTAPELPEFFVPGRDLALFADERSLIGKIEYYLDHEDERAAIASSGLQRAAEYSWTKVLGRVLEWAS